MTDKVNNTNGYPFVTAQRAASQTNNAKPVATKPSGVTNAREGVNKTGGTPQNRQQGGGTKEGAFLPPGTKPIATA